jgi:flagellar motor switch/type III secretory pathway protein FliN
LRATLADAGHLVVRGTEALALDQELAMDRIDETEKTAEAALEAPLVVRVEVGAVAMTAREWGELAVGDVIPVGRSLGELSVLRIGGVEVARGELVDVEGELGVRIRELGAKDVTIDHAGGSPSIARR